MSISPVAKLLYRFAEVGGLLEAGGGSSLGKPLRRINRPLRIEYDAAGCDRAEERRTGATALEGVRNHVALDVGRMGSEGKNFDDSLYVAALSQFQRLYLSDDEAAAAVLDEFVRSIKLIGSIDHIEKRVHGCRAAGVTCLLAEPLGPVTCRTGRARHPAQEAHRKRTHEVRVRAAQRV